MIKLKDILSEALPIVPMTIGFKPTEDYDKQIPAEFLRFYNNEAGNKTGRFIEMANQLLQTYKKPEEQKQIQNYLENIDNMSLEIQELLYPKPVTDTGHNVKSPQGKQVHAVVWKYLDNIHETVNAIINNTTFNGWPIETAIAKLTGLYTDIEELKNIYPSNYGPAPKKNKIGMI